MKALDTLAIEESVDTKQEELIHMRITVEKVRTAVALSQERLKLRHRNELELHRAALVSRRSSQVQDALVQSLEGRLRDHLESTTHTLAAHSAEVSELISMQKNIVEESVKLEEWKSKQLERVSHLESIVAKHQIFVPYDYAAISRAIQLAEPAARERARLESAEPEAALRRIEATRQRIAKLISAIRAEKQKQEAIRASTARRATDLISTTNPEILGVLWQQQEQQQPQQEQEQHQGLEQKQSQDAEQFDGRDTTSVKNFAATSSIPSTIVAPLDLLARLNTVSEAKVAADEEEEWQQRAAAAASRRAELERKNGLLRRELGLDPITTIPPSPSYHSYSTVPVAVKQPLSAREVMRTTAALSGSGGGLSNNGPATERSSSLSTGVTASLYPRQTHQLSSNMVVASSIRTGSASQPASTSSSSSSNVAMTRTMHSRPGGIGVVLGGSSGGNSILARTASVMLRPTTTSSTSSASYSPYAPSSTSDITPRQHQQHQKPHHVDAHLALSLSSANGFTSTTTNVPTRHGHSPVPPPPK